MNSESRLSTHQAYICEDSIVPQQHQIDGNLDYDQKPLKTLTFQTNEFQKNRACPICNQDMSIQVMCMNQQPLENYVKCIKNPFTNEIIMFHLSCLNNLYSQIQAQQEPQLQQKNRPQADSASFSEAIQVQKAAQITKENQEKQMNIRLQRRLNEIFLKMLPRFQEGVQPPFRNVMNKQQPCMFFSHLNEVFVEIKLFTMNTSERDDNQNLQVTEYGRVSFQLNPQSSQIQKNWSQQQNMFSQELSLFHLQFNLPIESPSIQQDLFGNSNCIYKGQQDDSFKNSNLNNRQKLIHSSQNDTLIIEYSVYLQSFGSQTTLGTFSLNQLLKYQSTQNQWIAIEVPSLANLLNAKLYTAQIQASGQTPTFSDTVFLHFNVLRKASRTLNQNQLMSNLSQDEGISLSHLSIQIEFGGDLQVHSQYFEQIKTQGLSQPQLQQQAPSYFHTQNNQRPQQPSFFQGVYSYEHRMLDQENMFKSQLPQQQRLTQPYFAQMTPQMNNSSHILGSQSNYSAQQRASINANHVISQQQQFLECQDQAFTTNGICQFASYKQQDLENPKICNSILSPFQVNYLQHQQMQTGKDSQIQTFADTQARIPNYIDISNVCCMPSQKISNDSELYTLESTQFTNTPLSEGISPNDHLTSNPSYGQRETNPLSCQKESLTDHTLTYQENIDNQITSELNNLTLQASFNQDSNSQCLNDQRPQSDKNLSDTNSSHSSNGKSHLKEASMSQQNVKEERLTEGKTKLIQFKSEEKTESSSYKQKNSSLNLDNFFAQLKTQKGSRQLQNLIKKVSFKEQSMIVEIIQDHIAELMIDLYGNYFCQTLFRTISFEQRVCLLDKLRGDFIKVSCNSIGTHSMQRLLDVICERTEKETVFESIKNHIDILAFNPNGIFVLIKVMFILNAYDTKSLEHFIIKKLLPHISTLIYDQQGVCIVNKMIQFAKDDNHRHIIIGYLVNNLTAIMTNTYANYAVTTAIETWGDLKIFEPFQFQIKERFQQFALHQTSANVIEKCVEKVNMGLILDFLEVLQREGIMKSLLKCPHTFFIIFKIYNRLQTYDQRLALCEVLDMNIQFINDKHLKEKCLALIACNGHPTNRQPFIFKGNTSKLSKKQLLKQGRQTVDTQYEETLTDLLKRCEKSSLQDSFESEEYRNLNLTDEKIPTSTKHQVEQQPQDTIGQTKLYQRSIQNYGTNDETPDYFDYYDNEDEIEFNENFSRKQTNGRITYSKNGKPQRTIFKDFEHQYEEREVPKYSQKIPNQHFKNNHRATVIDKNCRQRIYYNNDEEQAPAYYNHYPKNRH